MNKHEMYDTICYHAFCAIRVASKDEEQIVFRNVDIHNDEHIFLLNVAFSCWGLLGNKPVAVDTNWLQRSWLCHKYNKFSPIEKAASGVAGIDMNTLIEGLKGISFKEFGTVFSLSEINEEYYN